MNKDVELILLFGLAILYVLWAAVYLHYEKWKRRKAARNAAAILPRRDAPVAGILGKSHFVLPPSVPLDATLEPFEAKVNDIDQEV